MRRIAFTILAATCAANICSAQTTTWRAGAAAGQLEFSDGSTQSGIGVTISARKWEWLDISINPTYAWARTAAVQAGTSTIPARSVRGFTDLPLSFGTSRALPGPGSPFFGISLGVTLPTADTAAFGSGQMGLGISGSAGLAPTENAWFSVGAGRSLSSGYSAALSSSALTSVALSGGTTAGVLRLSASLSGDVGEVSRGYEPARSIAAGISWPVDGGMSFGFDASAGLSVGSPKWAYSIGFGTTPSSVAAATLAPYQRMGKAFGAGTAIKAKASKP